LVEDIRDIDMPRWSPDGRSLAFIGKVGDRPAQLYIMPAAGGTSSEVGDAPNGVQQYAWGPDGETIAYVTPDDSPLSDKDRRTHHD
jgi:Tol biopolymer transport system component